jgi:demethylmenaquinone methyltransferase/2-methoxy-6-polyprenyl-1,4-benzoquinol methylase
MESHLADRVRSREYVRSLFDGIAPRYDLLNHLLSAGIDRRWRRRAVEHLRDLRPHAILDVATGTGDLALEAARLEPSRIVGIDIAPRMLERARTKIARRGLSSLIELRMGEAEALPFPDESFDGVLVAFGVRNFEHLERGLGEVLRVLRPGGRLVVLEFSHPQRFPYRQLYFFYFTRILPLIGRAVSGHREAYAYLPATVLAFPEGEAFLGVLSQAGFEQGRLEPLSAGVATIYTGSRPRAVTVEAAVRSAGLPSRRRPQA